MKKRIVAVQLQHEGGRRTQTQLAGMSRREELAFWRTATAELLARQAELRRAERDATE